MRCDGCGVDGPTRHATFSWTMGYLVATSFATVPGDLCDACLAARYRSFNTRTAWFGWWSISSFPRALIFLGANAKEYRRAMSGAPLSANPTAEEVEDEQIRAWRAGKERAASRVFVWGAVIALLGFVFLVLANVFEPQKGQRKTTMGDALPVCAVFWVVGGATIWFAVSRRRQALHGPTPKFVGAGPRAPARKTRRR